MGRVNSFFFFFYEKKNEKQWKKGEKGETNTIFPFCTGEGRDVTRVYPQREYERNVYMFPAILYLVPRRKLPFIFRQRGVIALSEKAGIPEKCKETGTGVFERMIAGETVYGAAPTCSILDDANQKRS